MLRNRIVSCVKKEVTGVLAVSALLSTGAAATGLTFLLTTAGAQAATSVIVQDDQARRGGTARYWKHAPGGLNGFYYVLTNGSVMDNYAIYVSGLPAGRYSVNDFVPSTHGTTRSAPCDLGTMVGDAFVPFATRFVNQNAYYNVWFGLGTFDFPGTPAVRIRDNTGEPYTWGREIAFDAVMFTSVDAPPPTPSRAESALAWMHNRCGQLWHNGLAYCLEAVRTAFGLPGGPPSAAAAEANYRRKGVFHVTNRASDAPRGAWVFWYYKDRQGNVLGHVMIRCEHGVVGQDFWGPAGTYGRIEDEDPGHITLTCTGWVSADDAVANY